jgi:threonine aldolase
MVSKAVLSAAREHDRFTLGRQAGEGDLRPNDGEGALPRVARLKRALDRSTNSLPEATATSMNFASDNSSGVSDRLLAALGAANAGVAMPYGADPWTAAAEKALQDLFQRDCAVFLTTTGTAANALALAALTPPWGAIFCHEEAHIANDECGAPEFYTAGAKLLPLAGAQGKIAAETLKAALAAYPPGLVKQVQPAALSLTQASECGTLYSLGELEELSAIAHARGLRVHMDGARFANAVASLGCSPARMSWQAGIDILSFGATKNGAFCCEAVIIFDPALAQDFAFRRKRAGHTLSKSRFLGAQMCAYLEGGHWLELAGHANAMAARLAAGLGRSAAVRLPFGCAANEVFAVLPRSADGALKAQGARYYDWGARGLALDEAPRAHEIFVRLVTSFATSAEEVDQFVDITLQAAAH